MFIHLRLNTCEVCMFLLRNVLLSVGNVLFSCLTIYLSKHYSREEFFPPSKKAGRQAGKGHAAMLAEDTGNVLRIPLGILQFVHSSIVDVTRKAGLPGVP